MNDSCITTSPCRSRFLKHSQHQIIQIVHSSWRQNSITRLLFNSFCVLIRLIQKWLNINNYQTHGFVSGSDTTQGKLRYKMQHKTKITLIESLRIGMISDRNNYLLWWLKPLTQYQRIDHERWLKSNASTQSTRT